MSEKPKLAVYWAASCGGCEIAIANLHEKLLDGQEHVRAMQSLLSLTNKREAIEKG